MRRGQGIDGDQPQGWGTVNDHKIKSLKDPIEGMFQYPLSLRTVDHFDLRTDQVDGGRQNT